MSLRVMVIPVTPDNCGEEGRAITVNLPGIVWQVLERMCNEHGGNMADLCQRIFEVGLEHGPIAAAGIIGGHDGNL
jgi:hypothetical protein